MLLMALSMIQLYLLAKNDQNEVQQALFWSCGALLLVVASPSAKGIKNGITAFLTSRQWK